jgi:putative ATPase
MIEAAKILYIIRRMVRFASEDIGLADPNALSVAIAAKSAFDFIGPPEGYLAVIEAAIYLALAPKSNALYLTFKNVKNDIKQYQSLPVPFHINAPHTKLYERSGCS